MTMRPGRILVVDDLPANRRLLRAQLEAAGHQVMEAGDGVEALEQLERGPADAIISDILMPTMDGYRLCQEVRKDPRWRATPFIFHSATYRSPADAKLAADVGGDCFLTKPASAEAVTAALAGVLAARGAPRPAPTVHGELDVMRQYSERLVSKLAEQNNELYHRTEELEREIAERRVLEARIRESEQLRRLIVDTAPESVELVTPDGRLAEMNPAGLAMLEAASVDQVREAPLADFVVAEHRAALAKLHRRVMRGERGTLEFEVVGLAGTRRWLETHAAPLPDGAGGVRALLGVTRDITKRKAAEREIEQSWRRLRDLIDGMGPQIFVGLLSTDGVVLETNRPALAAAGLDPAEVIGRPFDQIPIWAWSEAAREQLRAAITRAAGGEPSRYDVQILVAGGALAWIDFSLQPLRGADGRVAFLIPSASLITERKEAERALREAVSRLQALARRLVELQEAEQRRMSVELHDRIGQNLTALGINLRLIADALPAALAKRLGSRLRDAASLLDGTVGAVRALMKELRPAVLEDYGLLAGLRLLGQEFEVRTGVATSVTGMEPVPRLAPAVELGLYRIAQEALNNVAKHAQARHVSIRLGCLPRRIELAVGDDGAGFDPAVVAAGPRSHWGLLVMQEHGAGTRISVEVERAA